MDKVDTPRVGVFRLNWIFSELMMLSCCSVEWITGDDTGERAVGDERGEGLLGVGGSNSGFS